MLYCLWRLLGGICSKDLPVTDASVRETDVQNAADISDVFVYVEQ